MNIRSIIRSVIAGMTGFIFLSGCFLNGPLETVDPSVHQTVREGNLLKSSCPRETIDASSSDVAAVAEGNNAFGWSLFGKLDTSNDNAFISPYSISLALAMAWVGAKGETSTEMAQALHFAFNDTRLLSAMNTIDRQLATRGQGAAGREGAGFRLQLANALWGEKTYTFLQTYLDPLAQYFGAGMRICDFIDSASQAGAEINTWASDETHGKITNLIPPGSLDPMTRLVITNTVYFDAAWADTFEADNTQKGTFYRSPSDSLQTWYMNQTNMFNYSESQNYQALELPYDGRQVSMVFVLPKSRAGNTTEQMPSYDDIKTLVQRFSQKKVAVSLPKFSFTYGTLSVTQPLQDMGMRLAFTDAADFSGIGGICDLYISDVLHQAFVAVDEKGTTAAAATAVVIKATCAPPSPDVVFTADHPFIFFIRDIPTGQILFIGYLATPASAS
jgi:serpin B